MSPASCIYEGRVRHRRFAPIRHGLEYRLFMMYVDLGELPGVFDGRWMWSSRRPAPAWFRRADHLGPEAVPLDQAVRDLVERETGRRPTGPVRLLTHFRYFGFCFNPVSFYYCFDSSGENVETVVAEIDNTPWGERHCYVLPESENFGSPTRKRFRFPKAFHVSPFMPMSLEYDWRVTEPGRNLVVHMENLDGGAPIFDATLTLRRRELGTASLARVLVDYPLVTAKVFGGIYWHALRLWLKRAPFFSHPKSLSPKRTGAST